MMELCSKTQIRLQNSIPKHISRHEPGLFNLLPLLLQAGPRFLESLPKVSPKSLRRFGGGLTRYTIHPIHPSTPTKTQGISVPHALVGSVEQNFALLIPHGVIHGKSKSKEVSVWRRQDAICRLKKPMPANSSTYPALNIRDFRVASASWI